MTIFTVLAKTGDVYGDNVCIHETSFDKAKAYVEEKIARWGGLEECPYIYEIYEMQVGVEGGNRLFQSHSQE
jgi:hypothetical protein